MATPAEAYVQTAQPAVAATTPLATKKQRQWPFPNTRKWFMQRSLATRIQIAGGIFVFVLASILIAIFSHRLQRNLDPIAQKLQHIKAGWLIVCSLIALVSIPPLFGHEFLAAVSGFVYGMSNGFLMVMISSIVGESFVYFGFRYFFKGQLDRFRERHKENYGVFVGVVEDGGLLMLFLIRMSIIPPHFSTPLFSSLETITWARWMMANALASPVKFFPPVYVGVLLRDKAHNSIMGNIAFVLSTLITVGTMWFIVRAYRAKRQSMEDAARCEEVAEMEIIPDPAAAAMSTASSQRRKPVIYESDGTHAQWSAPKLPPPAIIVTH